MPTPMQAFAAIAERHGINPNDADAVDDFFVERVPAMSPDEQGELLRELLEAEDSGFSKEIVGGVLPRATHAASQDSAANMGFIPPAVLREYYEIAPFVAAQLVALSFTRLEQEFHQLTLDRALAIRDRELTLLRPLALVCVLMLGALALLIGYFALQGALIVTTGVVFAFVTTTLASAAVPILLAWRGRETPLDAWHHGGKKAKGAIDDYIEPMAQSATAERPRFN